MASLIVHTPTLRCLLSPFDVPLPRPGTSIHILSLSLSLLGRAPPHVLKPGVGMWRWLGLELSNLLEASRHSLLDHVLIVV